MDEEAVRRELTNVPRETATHVHKLLSKIATNPDEPKFRRLKTTSRLFRERFGDAGALLGALGFAADGDLCAREGADGVEAALRLVDARLAMSDGEVERARARAHRRRAFSQAPRRSSKTSPKQQRTHREAPRYRPFRRRSFAQSFGDKRKSLVQFS